MSSSITNDDIKSSSSNEIVDILQFLKDGKISYIINPYAPIVGKLLYLYVLQKHNNDCLIVNQNGSYDAEMLLIDNNDNISISNFEFPIEVETYFNKIENCKNNGLKFVALPLVININNHKGKFLASHQNMLIFNLQTNEVYHFEPYGEFYANDNRFITVNNNLQFFFDKYRKK
jgi:hypothetical protein